MSHTEPVPGHPYLRRWKPGFSGNPAGRKPSFLDLAAQVRHVTSNGTELAEFLLAVVRGEAIPVSPSGRTAQPQRPTLAHRLTAVEMLLNRGWGRARETLELLGDSPAQQQQMRRALLASLTDDERAELRTLLTRAIARTAAAPEAAMPEAEPVRDPPEDA
jgi:hypothetical protein